MTGVTTEQMSDVAAELEVNQSYIVPPPPDPVAHARARVLLRAQIKGCNACHLRVRQWVREPVPWRGMCPADVVVVGEAPGERENRAGEPFVGPAGKLLDRMLEDAGWDTRRIMYCNTVCCYPAATPDEYAIKACRGNLDAQLSLANTPYVILAGNVALGGFRADVNIGNIAGSVFVQQGRLFHPMLHPAYILRQRSEREEVTEGLAAFRQVVLGLPWTNLIGDRCGRCYAWAAHYDPEGVGWCRTHWEKRGKTWTEREMERRRKAKVRMAKTRVAVRRRKQGVM